MIFLLTFKANGDNFYGEFVKKEKKMPAKTYSLNKLKFNIGKFLANSIKRFKRLFARQLLDIEKNKIEQLKLKRKIIIEERATIQVRMYNLEAQLAQLEKEIALFDKKNAVKKNGGQRRIK